MGIDDFLIQLVKYCITLDYKVNELAGWKR